LVNYKLLNKIVFNSIYKSNHWNKSKKFDSNQSYSGPGSVANSIQTNNLILELQKFFKENDIKNILDAPCGDCAWIKKIFETDINYTGIDIVEDLINQNKLTFNSNLNIKFYCEDLTEYKNFNNYDFILLRDFFIHLPLKMINKILTNLKNSNCRFFAFNNYESANINKEISIGQHRKINILKDPFNLGLPYYKIQEINNKHNPDQDNYIYIYKN
jgi:2-polyprenyl-3-methyl-5-hydroxy-6-metoxy-1,4-benzoquinol methylase|tara:strand:- start:738 stop:1382 length:645 start_codon:yes stop_codon:yes gene_type:complete